MSVPILGQAHSSPQQQLQAAVAQLAISLYSQSAAHYLAALEDDRELDAGRLRQLAKDAAIAAKAYFEGLGLAEFHAPPDAQAGQS